MTQRASLLRALLLAVVALPSAACGDSSSSETASTSPLGGGGGSGGTSSGGSDAGGTNNGGTDAGGTDAGGTDAGGTDAGGTDAGGTSSGGSDAGGTSSGGTDTGGTSSGGTSSGGTSSGGTDAGGTAGSAGSGGGLGGSGGSGGSAGGASFIPCKDPKAVEVGGKPTGYEVCSNGAIHRREALECPSLLPRPDACAQADQGGTCKADADCKDAPNGFCRGSEGGFEAPGCYCQYGCTKDSDCGAGSVCLCGDPVGRCVSSSCASDESCGGGACTSYGLDQICYTFGFACQNPADTCGGNNDCTAPEYCLPEGDHRICKQDQPCAVGRPLMVEDGWRFAVLVKRADW